jgi:hypothetical protein
VHSDVITKFTFVIWGCRLLFSYTFNSGCNTTQDHTLKLINKIITKYLSLSFTCLL